MRLLTIAAIVGISSVAAADPKTTDYVVKDGDTCLGIAIGMLGDRAQLKVIHALNPQLGKTPHVLHAGQILHLPIANAPDATLAHANNVVELRQAGADAWSPANVGAELFRAWRVAARDRSNAGIVFADKSQIEIRENTVVVIYGGSSTASPRRATLESGALRSRLAQLDGRINVETPSGTVEVATGATVVEAKPKKTLVSNHEGKPARLKNAGASTQIAAGFGADAEQGKKPSAARPLPPAPTWTTVPTLVVGWTADGATLAVGWSSSQAAQYRIDLRSSTGEVLTHLEVPSSATSLELQRIPAGSYVVAISSVDATGLEGPPAVTEPIVASLVALDGDAQAAPTGIVDQGPPVVRELPVGSVLATADCTVAGKHVVTQAGPAVIECGAAQLKIVATPIAFTAANATVALDQAAQIDIALAPVPQHGELVAHADPGIEITSVERTAQGASVHLTARRIGSTPIRLALATEGTEIELGRTSVDVAAPMKTETIPLIEHIPPRKFVWLTAAGGAAFDGPAGIVGRANLEVAFHPLIAAEAGAAFSKDRHTTDLGVALRTEVGSVVPMLRAGGVLDWKGHVGGRFGVAARIELTRRYGLYLGVDATFVGNDFVLDALGGLTVGLR